MNFKIILCLYFLNSSICLATDTLNPNRDYHSYANSDDIRHKHIVLDLNVDFIAREISGSVELLLEYLNKKANHIILDTKKLSIHKVVDFQNKPLNYELGEADDILGTPLIIHLPEKAIPSIRISYRTSTRADGLQWLTPAQTFGKKYPFLFSQSQPIHSRSWIPLQDTPKSRITFEASIKVPQHLRAVMSAANDPDAKLDGEFHFRMPQAMPTHLMALAVGNIAFKPIGQRSGVYSEPEMLSKATKEFEDTELMITITENMLGPYLWERFDLLVLPPSFPFGGMENPRLAFMTPTIIAGDKSLVSTVAHELAHSWTGNLVSNATWRDLWLNEGFTTYFAARIVEVVYGKERAKLDLAIRYQELLKEMIKTPPNDQLLPRDLRQRHADDAFSPFSYVKGAMFVLYLEHKLGRKKLDKFLVQYIEQHAFKPITTEYFFQYCRDTLIKKYPLLITEQEFYDWIYKPGVPAYFIPPLSDSILLIEATRDKWLNNAIVVEDMRAARWSVQHWLYFLNSLPNEIAFSRLAELDKVFHFTYSANSKIAFAWFLISINNNYQPAFPELEKYLLRVGRGGLIRPLYNALMERSIYHYFARKVYEKARLGYHPSLAYHLDNLIYK